jgi:protein O-GlcNAc transferase
MESRPQIPEQAQKPKKQVLQLDPEIVKILKNGLSSHQSGKLAQAKAAYEQVLLKHPENFDALNLLGVVAAQTKNPALAVELFVRAIEINPNSASAYLNHGNALKELKRLDEALSSYDKAITLEPDDAEAFYNRGLTLQELKRLDDALSSYDKAIALEPDYTEAFNNRGNALKELNRLNDALSSYNKAIVLKPDYTEAFYNRGNALKELNRLDDALSSYDKAIVLKPDYSEAFNNRGNALKELNRLNDALSSYNKAIVLKPDYSEAFNNRGNALKDLGHFSEAECSYRQAIRIRPDNVTAHSNLLLNLNYIESMPIETVLIEAKRYGLLLSPITKPKFTSWKINSNPKKLRIGFVSGDFNNHPVGYFTEGLFKNLDLTQFDIYAFPTVAKIDDLTARVKIIFHEWIPIVGKTDIEAATLIHQHGIHILIDLSGHTSHNRLPVFSYKPAPVQVSWLGYFATTGLPEMDYFLGDPHMSPKNEGEHFTEKVWNLSDTWFCLTPPSQPIPISDLPALKNGYVTFGCFGNLSKMNPEVIKQWAIILQKTSHTKLLLKSKQLADIQFAMEIRDRFANYGINGDRLFLEGPTSRSEYLEAYNRIDMVLDTFPYPGGTTSSEALWMGVPVLTLKGGRFLSHLGESIAHNTGQSGWIAEDLNDYINKAVFFSSDIQRLSSIRMTLRGRVLRSPLFDVHRFAKSFGAALWGMWREGSRNLPQN